ncbi:MAG: hypothetical protein ABIJ09_26275 [Pseudomonadota bacterium]
MLLLCACDGVPQRVLVLDRDADGSHSLRAVTLRTQPDLETLQSQELILRGGGQIVLDGLRFQQAAPLDEEAAQTLARANPGRAVQLRYTVVDGVAVPDDHESLLMVSAYHALEQVLEFLRPLDATLATRSTLEVCFHCTLDVDSGVLLPYLVSDNAAYVQFADLLVLLPDLQLSGLPLAIDAEVLAHELSHRVFRHSVVGETLMLDLLDAFARQDAMGPQDWQGYNLLMALNEGSADFLAASFAGRSRFGDASLGALVGEERDLEGARGAREVYDLVFEEAASRQLEVVTEDGGRHQLGTSSWNPYHLGTIWAGTLWQMARPAPGATVDLERVRGSLAPALTQTLRDLKNDLGRARDFDLARVLARFTDNVEPTWTVRICEVLGERFPGLVDHLPECP